MSTETTQTQSDAQAQNQTETETIDNPERGCGYLKEGKAYLRAETAVGGGLPAFVEFAEPVPFKEDRKRSYKEFPGLQFEFAVTGSGGMTETIPEGEAARHVQRLFEDRPTGTHAGEMVEFESHDLLLSVGKTHYPTAQEFVDEARVYGVSKAISVTSGNAPPVINPGRTRLFLIHPNAVKTTKEIETTFSEYNAKTDDLIAVKGYPVTDEALSVEACDGDVPVTIRRTLFTPGIFGYTYLSRVVYTEDADGAVPKYIQDYENTGGLDVVKPGRLTPYSEQEAFTEDGDLEEDFRDLLADRDALGDDNEEAGFRDTVDATEMERADLGSLAGRGWVEVDSPLLGQDALDGAEDGVLAVIRENGAPEAVFPSNNLNVRETGGYTKGESVVGPYTVEARLMNTGERMLKVDQQR